MPLFKNRISTGHICGVVIIQDMSDVTFGFAKNFSPTTGKKAMTIFQEAYPANPKAMFFLGMPTFIESIFNVMMSFSKEKIKKRIQLVAKDNYSKLHEELGTEILPKEYGGTNKSVQDHLGDLIFYVVAYSPYGSFIIYISRH